MVNLICGACLGEPFLQKPVLGNEADECRYCGLEAPVADLDDIALRCSEALLAAFQFVEQPMAVVHHGHDPIGAPIGEILEQMMDCSEDVIADLSQALLGLWGDGEGDEPYSIEQTYASVQMTSEWEAMERSLQHEARLINPQVGVVLEKVFGSIEQLRTRRQVSAVVTAGPGQPLESFQRARVFPSEGALEAALLHPERFLGPPPLGSGSPGRMNAKGISVFYGATDEEIAIAEVRPPVGSIVATATFRLLRPLRLLNLGDLSEVRPDVHLSYFDPVRVDQAQRCAFLNELQKQLLMPVMPEAVDQGYLITQAIADFLATHPTLNVDGIIFPSVQRPRSGENVSGQNVILFHKASTVHNSEAGFEAAHVSLMDSEDEHTWYSPEIWEGEGAPQKRASSYASSGKNTSATLALDRTEIRIHHIEGVQFGKRSDFVSYHRLQPGGGYDYSLSGR
jgi:hypothetical protein